jgi:hypothetical protein
MIRTAKQPLLLERRQIREMNAVVPPTLSIFRMRFETDDGDLLSPRPVIPKNSSCGRSVVLQVGLPDSFAVSPGERFDLMGAEAWVSRVSLDESDRLDPLLEEAALFLVQGSREPLLFEFFPPSFNFRNSHPDAEAHSSSSSAKAR